jgi:hypothetical protein
LMHGMGNLSHRVLKINRFKPRQGRQQNSRG